MEKILTHHTKINPMSAMKLTQLQYETETWKRTLGFMIDENIHLKNRLTEILKNNFDYNLLEELEIFHTHFLKEDDKIGYLKTEVSDLDKLLTREIIDDGRMTRKVDTKYKRIRKNIKNTEEQFARLRINFNNYLRENILQDR